MRLLKEGFPIAVLKNKGGGTKNRIGETQDFCTVFSQAAQGFSFKHVCNKTFYINLLILKQPSKYMKKYVFNSVTHLS